MHQVVTAQLAAKRAGTHSTKTRAEVRGGGAKPWRQKGTGRARQGSIRAPQWRGGGVAHGPKPRDYSQRTPKKMVRLALRSALSDRAAGAKVVVVDDWAIDAPKTKDAVKLLEALGLRTKGEREAPRPRRVVPHRRERVEVAAQPRRARADRAAGRAEHVRRARERLARVLASRRSRPTIARLGDDGDRRADDVDDEVATMSKDPRDIIIRPVVSEKSYAGYDLNVYTFVVAPDANKIEIRNAVEQLFARAGREGPHDQPQGQAQAQPQHRRVQRTGAPEAGHRHPRRRRGTHRHLRELTDAHPQTQADESRAPVPDVVRLRRGHEDQAREVADEAEAEDRRSQLVRPHDVAPPRRRSQAALPHRRLPPEQGRRAREGRGDRVRPEPQRAHRAAALPRRREALHHRPAGPRGRRRWCRAARAARSASATRCRCATSRSAPRCTTSS